MKLAEIHFDWNPSIPGADSRGENLLFPLKTQSVFRADDGWSIDEIAPGRVKLHREGMPKAVFVIGDGYTAVYMTDARTVIAKTSSVGDTISEASLGNTELVAEKVLAAATKPKRSRKKEPKL